MREIQTLKDILELCSTATGIEVNLRKSVFYSFGLDATMTNR
jgi:hypothetical protein